MSEIREKKIGNVTLRILRDECIGTVACRNVVPEVLDLDDMQIIDFVADPRDPGQARLAEACSVCPVDALELVDETGAKLAP